LSQTIYTITVKPKSALETEKSARPYRLNSVTMHWHYRVKKPIGNIPGRREYSQPDQEAFSKIKDRTDVGVGWLVAPPQKKKSLPLFSAKTSRP
jgi:hypothetical protein